MDKVYFSDNFFLLRSRIQIMQELLELEINGEIFNDQIMTEVRNIAASLEEHENLLNERNQLLGFTELAHTLFRIKHAFLTFLRNALYSQKIFLQQLLEQNKDEWHKIISRIRDDNEKLAEEFLNCEQQDDYEDNAIVSDAELELLFQVDPNLGLDED